MERGLDPGACDFVPCPILLLPLMCGFFGEQLPPVMLPWCFLVCVCVYMCTCVGCVHVCVHVSVCCVCVCGLRVSEGC